MAQAKNKTVIITGATSGIGKALAYRFAKEGFNLVLGARQYALLCEIAQDIQATTGVKAIAVGVDVSKEAYCHQLIMEAKSMFGRIDILINNAGISMRALFEDVELSVIKELMDVNFWGAVYCTKYALPEILKNKGSVIGISSIAGYIGLPGRSGYCASKYALQGFLESVRAENDHLGLHVMIACPGFTSSNIRNVARAKDGSIQGESPMDESKLMSPDQVADRIFKALVKRKRELIISPLGWWTVFLNKRFPRMVDHFVFKHFKNERDSPLRK